MKQALTELQQQGRRRKVYEVKQKRGRKRVKRSQVDIEEMELYSRCGEIKMEMQMQNLNVREQIREMKMRRREEMIQNLDVMEGDVVISQC